MVECSSSMADLNDASRCDDGDLTPFSIPNLSKHNDPDSQSEYHEGETDFEEIDKDQSYVKSLNFKLIPNEKDLGKLQLELNERIKTYDDNCNDQGVTEEVVKNRPISEKNKPEDVDDCLEHEEFEDECMW